MLARLPLVGSRSAEKSVSGARVMEAGNITFSASSTRFDISFPTPRVDITFALGKEH